MQRPTWATVVGILGILFSLGGLLYSAETAAMPKMMEFERDMFTQMQKDMEAQKKNGQDMKPMLDMMDKFWGHQPEWFGTASVVLGLVGLLINGLYFYSSIALLLMKKHSLPFMYTSIACSVTLIIVRSFILAAGYAILGLGMVVMGLIGAVLDLVLLVVILTSDKKAFA